MARRPSIALLAAGMLAALPALGEEEAAAPPKAETVVRAPRPRPPASSAARAEEARTEAGSQGDSLKLVQTLGGVARPAQGSSDLVVWGSAPGDTRVLVDGIEVPALYHLGGYRSVLAPGLVGRLDLAPGGWGVEHGRALGGLVLVEPQRLPIAGVHGSVGADLTDASALVSAAPADGFAVAAAGRYGYLDRILGPLLQGPARDRFALPSYWDAQVRATWEPRPGAQLGLLALSCSDGLLQSVDSDDPSVARSRSTRRSFTTVGLTWRSGSEEDRSTWAITPFAGRESRLTRLSWGDAGARLDSVTWRYGLRAAYRSVLGEQASLTAGLDALASDAQLARSGSMTMPPREGDLTAFGQPPGDEVAADRWGAFTVDAGLFAKADLAFGPLSLSPGLRLSAIGVSGSRLTPKVAATPSLGYSSLDWNLEPRASAALALGARVTAMAAAGLYHQAPDAEDRSAVFGAPSLLPEQAFHVVAGLEVSATAALSMEAVGFYKELGALVVRSPDPTPRRAEALVQTGSGRAYGGQLRLRQRPWHGFSGWVAYTLSRSERLDAPGGAWRLFDGDQTHVLTVSASQALERWRIGTRLRWASGCPRTPVVGAYYDARRDLFQPVFGDRNAERLPDFFQLDLQVERAFRLAQDVELQAYLEVLNLTNHSNVEEVVFSADYSQRGYVTGLPVFGTLGARLTW